MNYIQHHCINTYNEMHKFCRKYTLSMLLASETEGFSTLIYDATCNIAMQLQRSLITQSNDSNALIRNHFSFWFEIRKTNTCRDYQDSHPSHLAWEIRCSAFGISWARPTSQLTIIFSFFMIYTPLYENILNLYCKSLEQTESLHGEYA